MTPQEVYLIVVSIIAIAYSIFMLRDDEMKKADRMVQLFLGASILSMFCALMSSRNPNVSMLCSALASIVMIVAASLSFKEHRSHAAVMIMFGVMLMLPMMVRAVQTMMVTQAPSPSPFVPREEEPLPYPLSLRNTLTPFVDENGYVLRDLAHPDGLPPHLSVFRSVRRESK